MNYDWQKLNRRDKTSIMTSAVMRHIFIRGNNRQVGMREVNVNIGKKKSILRIDVLKIDKYKYALDGYEIKSCIEDFRTDHKWEKYLKFVNTLYFVFDTETYEKHKKEIIEKIGDKAGIYLYNPVCKWLIFQQGGKYTELPEPKVYWYKRLLFNYLYRNAIKSYNGRIENWQ